MPRARKVSVKYRENVEPEPKVVAKVKKNENPAKKHEQPAKKIKIEREYMTGDGLNVVKLLLSVQKNDCNSNKCLTELQKLYKKVKS